MIEPTPHAQKKKHSRQMATSCESCGNFVYDEDYECYTCEVDLDEDEMARFLQDKFYNCPYYQLVSDCAETDVGRQCVRYTKLRRLR
mgnify:CR=1 FL=1